MHPTSLVVVGYTALHPFWYSSTFDFNLNYFPDKPKVTVTRESDDVLEEGRSSVKMTCTSDANPQGRVFWRKYGASEERQFVETLEFNPVMRKDSGTYVCQAENSIGLSAEETVELDVLCKSKLVIEKKDQIFICLTCFFRSPQDFARDSGWRSDDRSPQHIDSDVFS